MNPVPLVDIFKINNEAHFNFSLPGWEKEMIDISFDEGTRCMTVSSTHGMEEFNECCEECDEECGVEWFQRQISFEPFTLNYDIPSSYDEDTINASFIEGILIIIIKKSSKSKKQINIR